MDEYLSVEAMGALPTRVTQKLNRKTSGNRPVVSEKGREQYPTGGLNLGVRGALERSSSVDQRGPVTGGSDDQLRREDSTSPTSVGPLVHEPVWIKYFCC